MRKVTILIMSGLLLIILAGCGEVEIREEILPDGSKSQAFEGYIYDEQTGLYKFIMKGVCYDWFA